MVVRGLSRRQAIGVQAVSLPHPRIPTFRCPKLGGPRLLEALGSLPAAGEVWAWRSGPSWGAAPCPSVIISLLLLSPVDAFLSLSTPLSFCLGLLPCVSLALTLHCLSVHFSSPLHTSIWLCPSHWVSFSSFLPPFLVCSLSPRLLLALVYLSCVCFPLAVKDLDTEKYFHLVSALPLALGVPAPHWEWTWPPATLGLWRPCSQAWGRLGWGVCKARHRRGPGRASQGRLRVVPGASTDPAWASQVLPTDELAEPKKSHRQSHRKKVLPEIYLTRLLSTKVGPPPACPHSRGSTGTTHWGSGGQLFPCGASGTPSLKGAGNDFSVRWSDREGSSGPETSPRPHG